MARFSVVWEADSYETDSAKEAAEEAWEDLRSPDSIANVFFVTNLETGEVTEVDLGDGTAQVVGTVPLDELPHVTQPPIP